MTWGGRAPAVLGTGLVGLACVVGALLARLVPQGQPYDEPSHLGTVLQYAHGHPLPVLGDPGVTYEAQMGPVYYAVSALPAQLVGDGDRHLHVLYALRFGWLVLVPLLGFLTFRLAQELRAPTWAAALAAGAVALNPTMLAIAASVQNDYLCIVLACCAGLVGCRALRPAAGAQVATAAGILVGLAVLTKVTAAALLIAFVVAALADRRSGWGRRCARAGAAVFGTVLVSGWWFVRNVIEYGDPTGSSAVHRTGVSFPPLAFTGLGSVTAWIRSLISYGFAPTEYYRNAFHAPTAVRLLAVVVFLYAVGVLALLLIRRLRVTWSVPDPPVVFAVSTVIITVVGYAVAAWTMQAIAPRLVFVAAPIGMAFLARLVGSPSVRALLTTLLGTLIAAFCVLDAWLLVAVAGMPADPVLWRF